MWMVLSVVDTEPRDLMLERPHKAFSENLEYGG